MMVFHDKDQYVWNFLYIVVKYVVFVEGLKIHFVKFLEYILQQYQSVMVMNMWKITKDKLH